MTAVAEGLAQDLSRSDHPEQRGEDAGSAASSSIDRVASVLRALAEGSGAGRRLSEIAVASGLGKTTTHRLLSSLAQVGFVDQDAGSRRYRLGFGLFALGMAAANRFDVIELARPSLDRLAEETGDTVFLSVRDRFDAVCLDRRIGSFPIKTLTLSIGDRRPLGVGAGSLALLAFMEDAEIERALQANAPRLDKPAFEPLALRQLIVETRAQGFSFNAGRIIPDMLAVGVPVFGLRKEAVGALSVAAISPRLEPERRASIVRALKREADSLRQRLDPIGAPRFETETA